MTLDEFAKIAGGLDRAMLEKGYRFPALAFLVKKADATKRPAGPEPLQEACIATNKLKATRLLAFANDALLNQSTSSGEVAGAVYELAGSSNILFLEKTPRNPFGDMITVGRAPNNDVCLAVSTVSKFHACFQKTPQGWQLHDQRAVNGTFVDDQRVAAGGIASVVTGSRISFGPDARARFYLPDALHGLIAKFRSGPSFPGPSFPV